MLIVRQRRAGRRVVVVIVRMTIATTLMLRVRRSSPVHPVRSILPRPVAVVVAMAIHLALPRRQVRRIGREDAQLPEAVPVPDGLLAMGLGEGRVRQARPRLEEGGRRGTAGALDGGHGGPALSTPPRAGRGGGRRRRDGGGGAASSSAGSVPFSIPLSILGRRAALLSVGRAGVAVAISVSLSISVSLPLLLPDSLSLALLAVHFRPGRRRVPFTVTISVSRARQVQGQGGHGGSQTRPRNPHVSCCLVVRTLVKLVCLSSVLFS